MYPIREITDQERLKWLRLSRTENIGPKTFHMLMDVCGTVEKAIESVPRMSVKGGRKKPITILPEKDAIKELELTHAFGAKIIAACEPSYPKILRKVADHPPVITVYGDPKQWTEPSVAIVGARNASANGCQFAGILAKQLGEQYKMATVSGLARGIDTAAHKASLATGTVAVVGGGINRIYPPENRELFHMIGKQGAVISEFPYDAVPKAQNFPRRNRIVSGMTLGTVVVEASVNSGSLITARMALEQGREVFAVPGSPLDPRSQGANKLIKQGAVLVESAEDIIHALTSLLNERGHLFEKEGFAFTEGRHIIDDCTVQQARQTVLEKIGITPVAIDELIEQTNYPAATVQVVLLELELADRLDRHRGNKVSLRYDPTSLFQDAG
jgi:DNA processing protein